MPFRIAQKGLEALEWPRVVDRLRASCRTPQARNLLAAEAPDRRDDGEPEDGRPRASERADFEPDGEARLAGRFVSEFADSLTEVRARLAAVGRMALSNYLAQTVFCVLLFYGVGLGLFGQLQRYQLLFVVAPGRRAAPGGAGEPARGPHGSRARDRPLHRPQR